MQRKFLSHNSPGALRRRETKGPGLRRTASGLGRSVRSDCRSPALSSEPGSLLLPAAPPPVFTLRHVDWLGLWGPSRA